MDTYDPYLRPDPREWNLLSEAEQIALVVAYHEESGESVGQNPMLHATMHVVVENQLALGEEFPAAQQTLTRLVQDGLNRHDAVHAIASVVCAELFELAKGKKKKFSESSYIKRLDALTVEEWRSGEPSH